MITLEKGKIYRKKILATDRYVLIEVLSDVLKDKNGYTFVYTNTWDEEKKEWCGDNSPFYLRKETLANIELVSDIRLFGKLKLIPD